MEGEDPAVSVPDVAPVVVITGVVGDNHPASGSSI